MTKFVRDKVIVPGTIIKDKYFSKTEMNRLNINKSIDIIHGIMASHLHNDEDVEYLVHFINYNRIELYKNEDIFNQLKFIDYQLELFKSSLKGLSSYNITPSMRRKLILHSIAFNFMRIYESKFLIKDENGKIKNTADNI